MMSKSIDSDVDLATESLRLTLLNTLGLNEAEATETVDALNTLITARLKVAKEEADD